MALLKIPEQQHNALAKFIHYSEAQMKAFLDALRNAPPALNTNDLANSVASQANIDKDEAKGILRLLAGLYFIRVNRNVPIKDFVEDVCRAAETTKKDELKPGGNNWESFKNHLALVLTFDQSLGVTAKAWEVMVQHEHVFIEARVLTDLRPVFKLDIEPAAIVVVHTLKIVYAESGSAKEFFVALDRQDVEKLKDVLDRAIKKENSLESLIKDTKLPYLKREIK